MKTINKSKGKGKKKKIDAAYLEKEAKKLFDEQFDEDTVPVDIADIVIFLGELTAYLKNKEENNE
jgi:hypothetical protein